MAEIRAQETQQELFKEFSEKSSRHERLPSVAKTQKPILLSTNIEQIILAAILLILSFCLIFFLGVLRGKALTSVSSAGVTPGVAPTLTAPISQVATDVAAVPQKTAAPANLYLVTASGTQNPRNLNKPYTLQLVTYKKKDLAEKDVAELRRRGAVAMIITSGDYYQVCAGQYLNKEEAKKDLKLFSLRYKDCFLRRR